MVEEVDDITLPSRGAPSSQSSSAPYQKKQSTSQPGEQESYDQKRLIAPSEQKPISLNDTLSDPDLFEFQIIPEKIIPRKKSCCNQLCANIALFFTQCFGTAQYNDAHSVQQKTPDAKGLLQHPPVRDTLSNSSENSNRLQGTITSENQTSFNFRAESSPLFIPEQPRFSNYTHGGNNNTAHPQTFSEENPLTSSKKGLLAPFMDERTASE
jgi:hypothetical protein